MMSPRGHTLAEALIALVLTAAIASALAGAFSAAQAVVRRHSWTVRSAETLRVSVATLADELRFLDPAADLRVVAPDSISLRAFRGTGVVCGLGPGGAALVRYRGLRTPEPAKDSVLVVDSIGGVRAIALLHAERAGDECSGGDGASVYRWSLPVATSPGTLLLLFESGSYHVADRALRYRRGEGGRQPLTAELLDDRGSAFAPALGAHGAGVPLAIEGTFALRPDVDLGANTRTRVARFRFALLNVRETEVRP